MTLSAIEVVQAVYAARRRRDVEAMLGLCTDAVIYTCNIDPDKPGSGNTMIGKAQNRAHLELIDSIWEPVSTSVGPLRAVGSSGSAEATVVRAVIRFSILHRPSGRMLDGTKTHEWTVRDGKVVSMCETLDRELIGAFLRMSEWAMHQPAAPTSAPAKSCAVDKRAT